MKKLLFVLTIVLGCFVSVSCFANEGKLARKSSIQAYIDYVPINSYIIDGLTYVNVEDLKDYGLNVDYSPETKSYYITRTKFSFPQRTREMWDKHISEQVGGITEHSDIKVYLDNDYVNSYFVNGETLIMIDELCKYGEFKWDGKVSIKMFQHELEKELENAENVTERTFYHYFYGIDSLRKNLCTYKGQVNEYNVPHGIGKMSMDSGMFREEYIGYFNNGTPDGLVFKTYCVTQTRSYVYKNVYFVGEIDGSRLASKTMKHFSSWSEVYGESNMDGVFLPLFNINERRSEHIDRTLYKKGIYVEDYIGKDTGYNIVWYDGSANCSISKEYKIIFGEPNLVDELKRANENAYSAIEFIQYENGKEVFYDAIVKTVSETADNGYVVLNAPTAGAKKIFPSVELQLDGERFRDWYIIEQDIMYDSYNLASELGLKLSWDEENQEVVFKKDEKTVTFKIGTNIMTVDGIEQIIEQKSQIRQNSSYVPVKALCNAFNIMYEWNEKNRTFNIITGQ